MLQIHEKIIETDNEGYLKDFSLWNELLAETIAENEKIILLPEHWKVIYFVRNFYIKFNISPPIRILVKEIVNEFHKEKNSSSYLYQLFPKGPAKQAAKIAGLPKPTRCI